MPIEFNAGETKEINVALQPSPVLPASLEGQVVDAESSAPVAGVLVEILGLTSTSTDINGQYSIINIPPGAYTVRFSHPDYEPVEY